jgi:hypothetical protein
MRPTHETVAELQSMYHAFLNASRFSTSDDLKDAVVGQIAVMDALRRSAPTATLRRKLVMMMARHAEHAGWLYEESGDVRSALYWIDRVLFWAQAINWHDMAAFTLCSRAQVALNYESDGRQAVELARTALEISGTLPIVKSSAAGWLSNGYALLGASDASTMAMDKSVYFRERSSAHPNSPDPGQQSTTTDNQVARLRSSSLVLLGTAETPIAILEPLLTDIPRDNNPRFYNVNRARLALAYANAGDRERASESAAETADALKSLPSQATWRTLARAAAVLGRRWPDRSDTREARALVDASRPPNLYPRSPY